MKNKHSYYDIEGHALSVQENDGEVTFEIGFQTAGPFTKEEVQKIYDELEGIIANIK